MISLKGVVIMKKLLAFACTALLLAGCGSSGEVKKESKTCSMEESGIKMDIKMDAEDDVIKTIELSYLMPGSLLGGDASELSEDDMKTMGDAVLGQLGVKEGEGINANFKAKDKDLVAIVNIDLSKTDASILNKMGISGNTKNVKLSETVESAEKSKMTCK